MDLLTALTELLKTRPGISGLVGTRIHQDALPQRQGKPKAGTTQSDTNYPAIVLHEISQEIESTLRTSSGSNATRVQVDCYAETPAAAASLREQVRLLAGYRGPAGDLFFQGITHEGGSGDCQYAIDGSDRHLRRRIVEFVIPHEEPVPVF